VLELNVNDQVISFEFAALDFRASSEIRYAYKLVGLNNKWEHIDNQHSITFPSLPHGNYELRIKATNSEGKWSRNEYVLRISVPPPFYLTTWFVLLVICSILGVVYLFVWWRTLQLKSIQTLLTKQVLERTMELRAEKSKVEDYSQEVERQNKELTDSIVYAKRIQNGLLPSFTELSAFFSDSFLIFKPRDIVSGDFYWMYLQNNILYIAAADCTGHGVPGAFMSLLGIASLNEIMKSYDSMSASDVLSALKEEIVETLQRGANHVQIRESIDIALVKLNLDTLVLEFAGAYNPLVVIRKGDVALEAAHRASYNSSQNVVLSEFRGQRIPIGFNDKNVGSYESYSMQVRKGDRFYLFSDGFVDQLNEAFTQKFYLKRLKDLLLNIQDLSMPDQQRALENAHYNWKGSSRQIDDILLVGFEI
jgi:serine phosphatase RsbU (regulator of sigma subunit)